VVNKINNWIDQTLKSHSNQVTSCECFSSQFDGFYPTDIISSSYFVVVDRLPKPDFPALRQAGFGDFIDMETEAVTYKNTYFIKKGYESDIAIHFHELVHVLQWKKLGGLPFIQRYIEEILRFGYQNAPLETMAYHLQNHFSMHK